MPRKQVRIGLDSSYVIARVCDWHEQHDRTLRSYEHWIQRSAQMIVPAHAILESYAVLTRIPAPHRLPPEIARQTLEENFGRTALITGVRSESIWKTIASLSRLGLGGGRIYEAVIASSAAEGGSTDLLTWNAKHFGPIAPPGLEVREP